MMAGERLHELITAYWGDSPPLSQRDGFSALGDEAREGWEHVAQRLIAEHDSDSDEAD